MKKNLLALAIIVLSVAAKAQTCPGLGSINYQKWNNITGTAVSNLTSNANYPNNPSATGTLTSFQIPTNTGTTNYGMKVYGYICPPSTGNYLFWISSDDAAELWLSTTSSAANKVKIAYNTAATSALQWTKYSTQKSKSIALLKGTKYYVEVLMKQGTGSDNMAVGWALPGGKTTAPSQVIPGSVLSTNNITTDSIPPSVPTALAASAVTLNSFTLGWAASSDNVGVAGYNVYRNGVKINTATNTTTSYSVTGLTPNTAYSITVSAVDAAGNQSVQSTALNVTTAKDATAPTVPTTLTATSVTATSFTLGWKASTDNVGVSGYNIFLNGLQTNAALNTTTSFNVTGLAANTTYAATVTAVDAAGNQSAASTPLNVTTLQAKDSIAPTAPTNLTAANATNTSFTLGWTASTDNVKVTGYDIYRNGTKINTNTDIGTTYSVTGLAPNSTYAITVKAKDSTGNQSAASAALNITTGTATLAHEQFTMRTIIAKQRGPHDLFYGPDGNIWYTERFAGTVSFVNPATGIKKVVLTLGAKMVQLGGQDGLMGIALHPQFNQGKPWVYISYTYSSSGTLYRKTRIERYTYDSVNQQLFNPVTVLENIPGSTDHNAARIAIGPDLKLYYTVGDMGAGQFQNINRNENAQNIDTLEGKILRLNTDSIGGSWIPTDNPFTGTSTGLPTPVYTLGHRNPQGLVWGNVGGTNILYSSEHGPYSDDEINIIERGRNYGWPEVSGFCDGNYNGDTLAHFVIINEQANCALLNVKEPIRSIFPFENPPITNTNNMTWPTMAPSGTEFYGSTAIPGWQNSLLVATLKGGTVVRYKLSNDGLSIISDTINYFKGLGRFRDVVVSPDGLKIYVACDSSGSTFGASGQALSSPANPGTILEFTYVPGTIANPRKLTQGQIQNDVTNKTLDVYPNPANQYVVVYNYSLDNGRTALLYDLNGRIVKKQLLAQKASSIEVSRLSPGLYILKVTDKTGKAIRTEKIVITH